MRDLFLHMVNRSISAGWVILAVLVIRFWKKTPKWLNPLLWGAVGARLMMPFSPESVWSLMPSPQPVCISPYSGALYFDTGIEQVDFPINDYFRTASPAVQSPEFGELLHLVSGVWITGALILTTYFLVSTVRLHKRLETAVLLKDNIYQSEQVPSPFVLGLIHPKIYLPFLVRSQDMPYIIAHERAHIRHKDPVWKTIGFLLLAAYWFNPLIWLAYGIFCRDIELACDEKVISALNHEQRADYAQALLFSGAPAHSILTIPVSFGETDVKERVVSVLNYKKPAFWAVVLAVVLFLTAAVCLLTDPKDAIQNPWTQEYIPGQGNIRGTVDTEAFESVSSDFAIGADQYGRAVFKEPYKAFDTFTKLYQDGIEQIRKEQDLPELRKNDFQLYKLYGWQVDSGTEEQRKQAKFVTAFLDIYENSFEKEPPRDETEIPTTEAVPEPTGEQEEDRLEEAVSTAVLRHHMPEKPDGLIYVESHRLLDTVVSEGTTTVYADMLCEKYAVNYNTGSPERVDGTGSPVALTFTVGNGEYILAEYWEPESGAQYTDSILRKFPEATAEKLFAQEKYNGELALENQKKAYEVQEQGNIYKSIEGKIQNICATPEAVSSPKAHIEAHRAEYEELLGYNQIITEYCFRRFMEGGETGLEGQIMASLCQDLMTLCSEKMVTEPKGPVSNGQEWFQWFTESAEEIQKQITPEEIVKHYPSAALYLRMKTE